MNETPTDTKDKEPVIDELADVKAKLTNDEKEAFFKCFLADKPYIAEEELFGGKLQIKFTTFSIKQNNTIMLQMQFDRDNETAKNTDAYILKVIQYRLATALLELDHKPFAEGITEERFPNNAKEGTTHILKKLELMEVWPVYKVSAITESFNRFEKKVRALTEESFKENF